MSGRTEFSRLLIVVGMAVIVIGAALTLLSLDEGEGLFFVFPFFIWTESSSPLLVGVLVLFALTAFVLPLLALSRFTLGDLTGMSPVGVCSVCQGQVPSDASFCPYCGSPVKTRDDNQET